jgi:FkbM family methyltransferase
MWASIGSYTVLASGVIDARTVAFAPDPATAAALERNISLNKIAERVELRISAVGDRDGEARFSIGLDRQNDARTRPVAPSPCKPWTGRCSTEAAFRS